MWTVGLAPWLRPNLPSWLEVSRAYRVYLERHLEGLKPPPGRDGPLEYPVRPNLRECLSEAKFLAPEALRGTEILWPVS